MPENALMTRTEDYLEPDRVQSMVSMAERLSKSRMFPAIRTADEAVAVIQYGKEIGLPPVMSLLEITPIQGRLTISGKAMLALFQKSGGRVKVLTWDKKWCSIELTKPSYEPMTYTYSWEKAQAEGLIDKSNWKKTPETMLYWRAITNGIRAFDPMVVLGLYTPEELGSESSDVPAPYEGEKYNAVPVGEDAEEVRVSREGEKMTTDEAIKSLNGEPLPPPAPAKPAPAAKPKPPARPKPIPKPAPSVPADPGIPAPAMTGVPQGRIIELIDLLEKDYGRDPKKLWDNAKSRMVEYFQVLITDRFPYDLNDDQAGKLVAILEKTVEAEEKKRSEGGLP